MTTNNGKRHRQRLEWESSSESPDPVCGWRRLAAMTARTEKQPRNVIVRAVGIYRAVIWFLGQRNRQFSDHVSKARKTQDKCVGTVLKPHFRHESLNDKHTAVRSFFIKKTRTSGLFVHVSCISSAIKHRETWIDSFIDIYRGKRVTFFEVMYVVSEGWIRVSCMKFSRFKFAHHYLRAPKEGKWLGRKGWLYFWFIFQLMTRSSFPTCWSFELKEKVYKVCQRKTQSCNFLSPCWS